MMVRGTGSLHRTSEKAAAASTGGTQILKAETEGRTEKQLSYHKGPGHRGFLLFYHELRVWLKANGV